MEKRLPAAKREGESAMPTTGGERRPSVPKWMERLPGNVKGLRRRSGKVAIGVEKRVGPNWSFGRASGDGQFISRGDGGRFSGGRLVVG